MRIDKFLWFFVLWRCGILALLGLVLRRLYGWEPAPIVVFVIIAIAADSIATVLSLRK